MENKKKMCESCATNEGEIKIFQMIGGKRRELFVCKKCAATIGISEQLGSTQEESVSIREVKHACSHCGWTTDDFFSTGFLGCPKCYDEFSKELKAISIFSDAVFGDLNVPPPVVDPRSQISALKWQIEQAVKREEFEKAARLRDQLYEIEAKLKTQGLL